MTKQILIACQHPKLFRRLFPDCLVVGEGDMVAGYRADLILIDRMLPESHWLENVKIRGTQPQTPVLYFDDRPW